MKNILIITILFFALPVMAYYNPGNPAGFVNDYADIIMDSDEQALENKLVNFEKESSNEISVVTILSLEGDIIENFASGLFEEWKIGKENNDNGILILVAKDDHKMRIEVGYGLEGALTDAQSWWIIDDIMKPAFREENYYKGIDTAVDNIIAATHGEYLSEKSVNENSVDWEFFIFFAIFIFMWLASILGRSKSWWAGGVLGAISGIIIGIIKGFIYFGIISIAFLIPFGLLFDYFISKSYKKHKALGTIPWWIGGGRGGRSGFGGGGFSGFGGGSSGGGGASGSW